MQNDIIRMASMAGFETKRDMAWVDQWEVTRSLERFAALVAAAERTECVKSASMLAQALVLAERENCAQVCDEMEKRAEGTECCKWPTPADCAAAIRARSNVQQKPQK